MNDKSDKLCIDIKDIKRMRILILAVLTLFLADSTILAYLWEKDLISMLAGFIIILLYLCLLGVVAILSFIYFNMRGEIKRLSRKGYIVPYNKKDYGKSLELLSQEEKKKYTKTYPVSKRYLTIAAIVITVLSGIYMVTFAKMPHFIVWFGMVLFMIYYIIEGTRSFYREELDDKAASEKRMKRGYIFRAIEFVIIYGLLLTNLFVADYHLLPQGPRQYEQAIRYYKRTEPEKYRIFPDKIPNNASDYFRDFNMSYDGRCYVYFMLVDGDIEEYCDYFESLDESVIIYTKDDSGYQEKYEYLSEEISYFLRYPSIHYDSRNQTVIYEFDRWIEVEEGDTIQYYSMYAWVGLECNEVVIGFSKE